MIRPLRTVLPKHLAEFPARPKAAALPSFYYRQFQRVPRTPTPLARSWPADACCDRKLRRALELYRRCAAADAARIPGSRYAGRAADTQAARTLRSSITEPRRRRSTNGRGRSEEHTSELQSQSNLVCRLLLEKKTSTSTATSTTATSPASPGSKSLRTST